MSSAIRASCLGERPAPSITNKDAPAATSMQHIVRRLYAAALCNAVCPTMLTFHSFYIHFTPTFALHLVLYL